ncbi:MAG TPA: metal-dependent hydrolase [Blastocatellia bacterium]|nr:metal-dependent hydrolase [Blastocatellia bacterium]
MENLSHTLFGLVLSKAGLEEATPLAPTALVISSNLPDVDALFGVRSGSLGYIKYHRGITHSFIGIACLAAIVTLVLVYLDRRLRLRRDPFFRPARPARIFWISLLGGLGHLLLDFTNNYGVRPLLPFDGRWFYGDMVFIADPWIWLILGAAAVWATTAPKNKSNHKGGITFIWLAVAAVASALLLFAPILSDKVLDVGGWVKQPSSIQILIPVAIRVAWFCGLGVIALGSILGWGKRRPKRVAKFALIALGIYLGGMWMARQQAVQDATAIKPAPQASLAVWPQPANPSLWRSVAAANNAIYTQNIGLLNWLPINQTQFSETGWKQQPALDRAFETALRTTGPGRLFLDFARFPIANITQTPEGYAVVLRDSRFNLQLHANLDTSMNVLSCAISWF